MLEISRLLFNHDGSKQETWERQWQKRVTWNPSSVISSGLGVTWSLFIASRNRSQASLQTDLLLKWIMMSSGNGAVRDLRLCGFDRNRFLVLSTVWLFEKIRGHVQTPVFTTALRSDRPRCTCFLSGRFPCNLCCRGTRTETLCRATPSDGSRDSWVKPNTRGVLN